MKTKKKSSPLLPVSVGIGLTLLVVIIATTPTFDPLIDYIHTNSISPMGATICIIAAVFAFFAVFKILSKLGRNMLPEDRDPKK